MGRDEAGDRRQEIGGRRGEEGGVRTKDVVGDRKSGGRRRGIVST